MASSSECFVNLNQFTVTHHSSAIKTKHRQYGDTIIYMMLAILYVPPVLNNILSIYDVGNLICAGGC